MREVVTVDMMVVALLAMTDIRWSPTKDRQVSTREDVIVFVKLISKSRFDDYLGSRSPKFAGLGAQG